MKEVDYSLPTGTQIAEFRIIDVLGVGGFGITYKAEDTRLGRLVAIKEFLPVELAARGTDSKTVMARTNVSNDYQYGLTKFLDEAKTLAKFNHPNIVRVHTFLETNGTAYLVMEYVEGQALDEHLKQIHFTGNMAESRIRDIIEPLLKGLIEVHKAGLLHRDIKPGNIYLKNNGEPMLIDFGAARQSVGEKSKSISAIISQGYAPPEQYTTRGKQGAYTDIYAIGAVMYYLVSGTKPVESTDRQHDILGDEPDPLPVITSNNYSDAFKQAIHQAMILVAKKRCQNIVVLQQLLSGNTTDNIDLKTQYQLKDETKSSDATVKTNAEQETYSNQINSKSEHTSTTTNIDNKKPIKKVPALILLIVIILGGYVAFTQYQQQQVLSEKANIAKQNDNNAWQRASKLNTTQSYQFYIDNWPQGQHIRGAKSQLIDIQAQVKLAQLNEQERIAKLKTQTRKQQITTAQKQLKQLKYQTPLHGDLDKRTQKAIEAFEKQEGMVITGDVDDILLSSLNTAVLKQVKAKRVKLTQLNEQERAAKLKKQTRKQQITIAQQRLKQLNYQTPLHGDLDKRTQKAIEAFEKQEGMVITGDVDDILLSSLNTAVLKQVKAKRLTKLKFEAKAEKERVAGEGLARIAQIEDSKVALTISTTPTNVEITFINDKINYQTGILLLPKSYQITLSKQGYHNQTHTFMLSQDNSHFSYQLEQAEPQVVQSLIKNMKSIPAGSFQMGCVRSRGKRNDCQTSERSVRHVSIAAFKMMTSEVTFAMWDTCVADDGCAYKPNDEGWGRASRPVINVSYNDITQQFIPWLNKVTGKTFSLPSEAQWEYAARSSTTTKYSWGNDIDCSRARYGHCGKQKSTNTVKSFNPNKWGLYDMHGNVWEWTQDCWNDSYKKAPRNGSAWLAGSCDRRVVRGGSWVDGAVSLRSANRARNTRTNRGNTFGFRLLLSD